MPEYTFKHPKKEKYIDVIMSMNEEHKYVDEKGVEWERVFCTPQVGIDTKWDAHDSRNFVEKTAKMKGTIGDLEQKSAELSAERESKMGIDPVKQAFYEKEKKRRGGLSCHAELKEKAAKTEIVI